MIRRTFFKLALGVLSFPFVAARSGPAWWEWLVHPKLARLKARGERIVANAAYLRAHWSEVEISIASNQYNFDEETGEKRGPYTLVRGAFQHPSVPKRAAALTQFRTEDWAIRPYFQELAKRDVISTIARLYADKGVILA